MGQFLNSWIDLLVPDLQIIGQIRNKIPKEMGAVSNTLNQLKEFLTSSWDPFQRSPEQSIQDGIRMPGAVFTKLAERGFSLNFECSVSTLRVNQCSD